MWRITSSTWTCTTVLLLSVYHLSTAKFDKNVAATESNLTEVETSDSNDSAGSSDEKNSNTMINSRLLNPIVAPNARPRFMRVHPDDVTTPLPYTKRIHLRQGQWITVHGLMQSRTFVINLLSGSPSINGPDELELEQEMAKVLSGKNDSTDKVAQAQTVFHMKVLFDEKTIIFNTLKNGHWGSEEVMSTKWKASFDTNEHFDIRIRSIQDRFQVWINRCNWYEYKYRMPLAAIQYLAVNGNGNVEGVHLGGAYYPFFYSMDFPGGHFAIGTRMYMYVIPMGNCFAINFASEGGDHKIGTLLGDELFRYHVDLLHNKETMTGQINGTWGQDEEVQRAPVTSPDFQKDVITDIVFLMEPYCIKIFIQSRLKAVFAHRCANPADCYKRLVLGGKVEMIGIEFSND